MPVENFTPVLLGTGSNPSVTYSNQTGQVIRLGQIGIFQVRIDWTARSGGSGQVTVGGYNTSNLTNAFLEPVATNNVSFTTQIFARGRNTSSGWQLIEWRDGANESAVGLAQLGASGRIQFSGIFMPYT